MSNKTNGNDFTLVNYFDVWGNADDGFEVNNQCIEEDELFIRNDATDDEIITMLVELGYLKDSAKAGENVIVTNMGDDIELEGIDGMPLFGLRMNY